MKNFLVIKLGALGDFVLAFGPFAAIRAHHPYARITLLTTAPFAGLARSSPWFDEVRIDPRPSWWDVPGVLRLSRALSGFDFVYDLQTSSRSSRYFHLAGRPGWSGIARGSSHPHSNPARDALHTIERQHEQLAMAGINDVPNPDLSWLTRGGPEMPAPFALLIPGAAAHRPAKRWPKERFAALAALLARRGILPAVVGTATDRALAASIRATCPEARDLTGQTSIADVAALAARAEVAVGNDTGPMHLAAAVGCRCVVLFSGDSDPAITAPRAARGGSVTVLREKHLADLSVERVAASMP